MLPNKKLKILLVLLGSLSPGLFPGSSAAQETDTTALPSARVSPAPVGFPTPAEGKALVIFTRPNLEAAAVRFHYFDGDRYLGKIGVSHYLVYECGPGSHLLWAASENYDFVEADLEAGRVYVIDSKVRTGMVKARVKLVPVDPQAKNYETIRARMLNRVSKREKVLAGDAPEEPARRVRSMTEAGQKQYEKMKQRGDNPLLVKAGMYVQ